MKEAYTVKGVRGAEEFTYSGLQVGAAHVQSPALRLPLLSTPEARTLNSLHAIATRYKAVYLWVCGRIESRGFGRHRAAA